jgi:putative ABC transport system permease protein
MTFSVPEINDYRTQNQGEIPPASSMRTASPDYFKTLGIPLLNGRVFTPFDNTEAPTVSVVSKSLALHRWGAKDPVGTRITFDRQHWIQIVGVVGDVKEFGLNQDPPDQIYQPVEQRTAVGMYWYVQQATR